MSGAGTYVPVVVATVSTILGGALIAEAWAGDAPKRSAIPVGLGFLFLGAVISFEQTRRHS